MEHCLVAPALGTCSRILVKAGKGDARVLSLTGEPAPPFFRNQRKTVTPSLPFPFQG